MNKPTKLKCLYCKGVFSPHKKERGKIYYYSPTSALVLRAKYCSISCCRKYDGQGNKNFASTRGSKWCLGKKWSDERKLTMSKKLKEVWTEKKRKEHSELFKKLYKQNPWIVRKKSPINQKKNRSYYRNLFAYTMRHKVFERDDYTCRFCGIRGADMQVDHINSWAKFPDLRFEMENCRTLCAKCHYQITFSKPMPDYIKKWGHRI